MLTLLRAACRAAASAHWGAAGWEGTVGLGGAGAVPMGGGAAGGGQTVPVLHLSPVPLVLGGFATGACVSPGSCTAPAGAELVLTAGLAGGGTEELARLSFDTAGV